MTTYTHNPGPSRYERARTEFLTYVKAARDIVDRAEREGRQATPAEEAEANRHLDNAKHAKAALDQAQQDDRMKSAISDFAAGLDLLGNGHDRGGDRDLPAYAQRKASSWAKDSAERITKVQSISGIKAIVSGSVDVRSPADGTVAFPQYPLRVLDLVTDRKPTSGNVFSFLRQTVRQLHAAPVPDGGTKPTSVVTTAEVEDRCRVVAHISEPVVERLLTDFTDLEDFLRSELEFGVLQALEAQLVLGDGTGENFTGILHTSGIIGQAYASSPWVSIRKGLTALEVAGEQPTAIALHPADVEAFDLAREGADGGWLLATAPGNITTGLPLVRSIAVPVGTALIGDWRQTRLYVREDAKLDMDRSGDLFSKNQVRLRVEGRWGLAVRRPSAFAAVDLTAA